MIFCIASVIVMAVLSWLIVNSDSRTSLNEALAFTACATFAGSMILVLVGGLIASSITGPNPYESYVYVSLEEDRGTYTLTMEDGSEMVIENPEVVISNKSKLVRVEGKSDFWFPNHNNESNTLYVQLK